MLLQWSSLLFILGFSTSIISIHGVSEDGTPPPLNFFNSVINFEYMDPKTKTLTNHTDNILSVGTIGGSIVGSAQSFCRHINPPAEQVIVIKSEVSYYPLNGESVLITRPNNYSCAPLTYGCITLVHNYCSFPADAKSLQKTTKTNGINAILSKTQKKPAPGDELIAVFSAYSVEKIQTAFARKVTVKDFGECEKQFDPEALYFVDKDEQFCTDRILPELGDDPVALPNALLFSQPDKKKKEYYLVGIESKAQGAVSLSTFAPYHCQKDSTCSP